ncbi:hypothetical protein [Methanospirillum sp.]
MNPIAIRTVQDTPENELLIRGLQDYVSAHEAFLSVSNEIISSVNTLVNISENL